MQASAKLLEQAESAGAGRRLAEADRQRARQLEVEARELAHHRRATEGRLEDLRARSAELEARWADISTEADDALRRADEAKQQAALLRRAMEEKDAKVRRGEEAKERSLAQKAEADRRRRELEAAFEEQLQREVSQKEQELLEEVAYLRKSVELKERRVQDLAAENKQLEPSFSPTGGGGERANFLDRDREAMLEAHGSIAKAYGDAECERLTLKMTGMLFKYPLFRRIFFGLSAAMWLFALGGMASSRGGPPVHV